MSSLYIEEHDAILIDPSTETLVPMVDRYVTAQSTSLDATASISGQTFPQTRFVAITADADCRFAIGASPNATAGMRCLPVGQTLFFRVYSGERVSAIIAKS